MKTLFLTDLHYDDDEFLLPYQVKYIDHIIRYVRENNISRIILLGDWSNKRKYISYKTLDIIKPKYKKLFDMCKDGFYFIIGNHDASFTNSNDVFSAEVIFDHPAIIFVKNKVLKLDNYILAPWISTLDGEDIISDIEKYNKAGNILLGHFELTGFKTNDAYIMKNGQLSRSSYRKYDKVISGHYHLYQNKKNVYYLGTPYQTRFGEGCDHSTFIMDDEGELISIYVHEDIFVDIHIENFDDDEWKEKIVNINNKKVKIAIDTDDRDVIDKIISYVSTNYSPYDINYFFRNKDLAFDKIEIENRTNEENEVAFFNDLLIDEDIKDDVEKRFYNYKRITSEA